MDTRAERQGRLRSIVLMCSSPEFQMMVGGHGAGELRHGQRLPTWVTLLADSPTSSAKIKLNGRQTHAGGPRMG
jgi:hypothetical protein